jgi:hypothetical protein
MLITLVGMVSVFGLALYLDVPLLGQGNAVVTSGTILDPSNFPGQHSANIYLTITYTGGGSGGFTYVIRWNDSDNNPMSSTQYVTVSSGSPFTYYNYIPPPANGISMITFQVFRGDTTSSYAEIYHSSAAV